MKCPTCGEQTEGVDHNDRGLRCTFCWALLPDKPLPAQAKSKAKRRRKTSAEVAIAKGPISGE